jgi:hypothetical protein
MGGLKYILLKKHYLTPSHPQQDFCYQAHVCLKRAENLTDKNRF